MSESVKFCLAPLNCDDLAFCYCDALQAQSEQIARLREALHQCAEYFDDHQEVDTSDGEPVANKEMRLLGVVCEALGEK